MPEEEVEETVCLCLMKLTVTAMNLLTVPELTPTVCSTNLRLMVKNHSAQAPVESKLIAMKQSTKLTCKTRTLIKTTTTSNSARSFLHTMDLDQVPVKIDNAQSKLKENVLSHPTALRPMLTAFSTRSRLMVKPHGTQAPVALSQTAMKLRTLPIKKTRTSTKKTTTNSSALNFLKETIPRTNFSLLTSK